ncbi:MAG: hypothetical protein ABSC63_13855 [Candidatus Binataceae bacterium]|jgi:hypothetical protein
MTLTCKDFQRRIANTSVTPSALRNQGAKGIVKGAREFLAEIEIERFAQAGDESSFRIELDRQTELLAEKTGSWGAARKALNIFLCEAFFNRVLHSQYQLERIGPFLEVVLDNIVAWKLWEDARGELPRFKGIKWLTPEVSRQYQDFASRHARHCSLDLRVHLEILYWREVA